MDEQHVKCGLSVLASFDYIMLTCQLFPAYLHSSTDEPGNEVPL